MSPPWHDTDVAQRITKIVQQVDSLITPKLQVYYDHHVPHGSADAHVVFRRARELCRSYYLIRPRGIASWVSRSLQDPWFRTRVESHPSLILDVFLQALAVHEVRHKAQAFSLVRHRFTPEEYRKVFGGAYARNTKENDIVEPKVLCEFDACYVSRQSVVFSLERGRLLTRAEVHSLVLA